MNNNPTTPKDLYYFNKSEQRKINSDRYKKFITPNQNNWNIFNQIKGELAPKIEQIQNLDEIEVIKEANKRSTDAKTTRQAGAYKLVSLAAESIKDNNLKFAKEKKEFEIIIN